MLFYSNQYEQNPYILLIYKVLINSGNEVRSKHLYYVIENFLLGAYMKFDYIYRKYLKGKYTVQRGML